MTQPKRGSLREPQSSVLSTRKHSVVLFEIYHNFCPPMGYACAPDIALKAFGNATLPRIGGIFRQ
jgi:hypothetical protein